MRRGAGSCDAAAGGGVTRGAEAHAGRLRVPPVQTGRVGNYVFVVKADAHAAQRSVTVTRVVEGQAVIGKGVAVGETIVLDGQSRVENGAALKVTEAAP